MNKKLRTNKMREKHRYERKYKDENIEYENDSSRGGREGKGEECKQGVKGSSK